MIAIPKSFKEALDRVQARYPSAFIAGGCLRDLFYGVPIKDIDIWIPVTSVEDNQDKLQTVQEMFPGCVPWGGGAEEDSFSVRQMSGYDGMSDDARDLTGVYEVTGDTLTYPLNIIFMAGTQGGIVSSFDMSFCRIAWDGQILHANREFMDTVDTGVVKILHPNRIGHRQAERVDRMREKYPNVTFVNEHGDAV